MYRLIIPIVVLLLAASSADAAAAPLRCNRTHGKELAHSAVVKVYKVKSGRTYRFFGCARPRGPVIALTQPFSGNEVNLVASAGANVAFTRTIRGSDTIAVVDARTGRKRHGLFPPSGIEFDIDSATPQIGAARVNFAGDLVVASYTNASFRNRRQEAGLRKSNQSSATCEKSSHGWLEGIYGQVFSFCTPRLPCSCSSPA